MARNKTLLVGPYPDDKLQHIGGTTILFKLFVEYFINHKIPFAYISTIKYQGLGHRFLNFVYVFVKAFLELPKCNIVILNLSRRGLKYIAPCMYFYARLIHVKVAIRMFGGDSKEEFSNLSPLSKKIYFRIFKNADLLFFETKNEVEHFKKINKGVYWFPNCRRYPLEFKRRTYKKKFVFISQVKIDKGIKIVLDLFNNLSADYSLEIYGPILDQELLFVKELSWYKGIIPFDEVSYALDRNDVLLLPTFYKGEGYPGVVIEAYSMSIPVITTYWKSIPEIVQDGVTGFLIEPNSIDALKKAVGKLNDSTYGMLNVGAFEMSEKFQEEIIHERVTSIIRSTVKE